MIKRKRQNSSSPILSPSLKNLIIEYKRTGDISQIKIFFEDKSLEIDKELFIKSFAIFLLPNNINTGEGKLNKRSLVSKYILYDNLFIKVVIVSKELLLYYDTILFDIINHYLLNKIGKFHYITQYKYSLLNYYRKYGNDDYWNYRNIIDINHEDSPYNLSNISTRKIIYNLCHIYITDKIDGISLKTFLSNEEIDDDLLNKILEDIPNFIEEYILLGTEYGFIHNDFHLDNIFINYKDSKLKIIDFGKSFFGKFMEINDDELNEFIKNEYDKLGFKELLEGVELNGDNYYNFLYNQSNLFKSIKTLYKINDNYIGFILDIIPFIYDFFKLLCDKRKDDVILNELNEYLTNPYRNKFQKYFYLVNKIKDKNEYYKYLLDGILLIKLIDKRHIYPKTYIFKPDINIDNILQTINLSLNNNRFNKLLFKSSPILKYLINETITGGNIKRKRVIKKYK